MEVQGSNGRSHCSSSSVMHAGKVNARKLERNREFETTICRNARQTLATVRRASPRSRNEKLNCSSMVGKVFSDWKGDGDIKSGTAVGLGVDRAGVLRRFRPIRR